MAKRNTKTEQKPSLPPHLLALVEKLEAARAVPTFTVRDVTPKGYGPNE